MSGPIESPCNRGKEGFEHVSIALVMFRTKLSSIGFVFAKLSLGAVTA